MSFIVSYVDNARDLDRQFQPEMVDHLRLESPGPVLGLSDRVGFAGSRQLFIRGEKITFSQTFFQFRFIFYNRVCWWTEHTLGRFSMSSFLNFDSVMVNAITISLLWRYEICRNKIGRFFQVSNAQIWSQGAEKQRRKVNVVGVGGGGRWSVEHNYSALDWDLPETYNHLVN